MGRPSKYSQSGLVSHSDAGTQYVSIAFTQRLLDAGIDPSVGSVGDAYDNALAETTVGSFKTEQINRNGPWRDINAVEVAAFEWVDFFNTQRPHEYLDDLTPVEAEKLHYDRPANGRVIHQTESPDSPGGVRDNVAPVSSLNT